MNKIILLAAAIMLYSCGDDGFYGKSLPADREGGGYKSVMLPKYRLPHEKLKAQKGDQYSDYRLANPEFYAITATPSGTFRHHNQWEDSQVFFIPYMKSLPAAIKNTITDIVKNTIDYIPVMVAVTSQSNADDFVVKLKNAGVSQAVLDEYLSFFIVALDSIWLIDYGPIPLVNGKNEIAFADFKYYHYRIYDDAYPTKLGNYMGVNTFRAPMYWEGGNFQGDGEGTCYTSQGTLWENAGYSWDDIKKILKDYLKCDNLIILKPLAGEGTAHIDMYMKLGAKDVVVVGNYTEAQDSQNKKVMDDNIQILDAVSFNDGKDLKVFVIPMPDNKGSYEKIWRTYANSALANGLNLVPVYSVNKDLEALAM
ncbi:MAG: agmatine deiminase family protein, partial [Deltaproteobacteria bacterium]|nr:agmatine deiminase family protein [Deltaproteobacteria bacterium]